MWVTSGGVDVTLRGSPPSQGETVATAAGGTHELRHPAWRTVEVPARRIHGDTLPGVLVNGSLSATGLSEVAAGGCQTKPRPESSMPDRTSTGLAQPDGTRHGVLRPTGRREGKDHDQDLKTGRVLTAGAALLGALALSGPAHAANRTSIVAYGAYTRAQAVSYGANGAVRICDVHADGDQIGAH